MWKSPKRIPTFPQRIVNLLLTAESRFIEDVAADGNSSSFQHVFLSQLPLIDGVIAFVVRHHHLSVADGEDFASAVKLKLIADNYAVLRNFKHHSSLRTYLAVVVQREFVEFQRARWGKWSPSAEAIRGGPVLVVLEQYMGRDGYSFDEACELLAIRHGVKLPASELERLAGRLPRRYPRRFETEDALADIRCRDPWPDQRMVNAERTRVLDQAYAVLNEISGQLSRDAQLILAYRFVDGFKLVDIAHTLRLDQKALYRKVEAILDQLRKGLEARGISAEIVSELFTERE